MVESGLGSLDQTREFRSTETREGAMRSSDRTHVAPLVWYDTRVQDHVRTMEFEIDLRTLTEVEKS